MDTLLDRETELDLQELPAVDPVLRTQLTRFVALFAIVVGSLSVLGGILGAAYTWGEAVDQAITTPGDAAIAETPVRGPFTMWAQQDIITQHQLERTDGLYYAQMDRTVQAVDDDGAPMFDEAGDPVMVANAARLSWLDATALTTVLSLGILAYAFSAFAALIGLVLIGVGIVLRVQVMQRTA